MVYEGPISIASDNEFHSFFYQDGQFGAHLAPLIVGTLVQPRYLQTPITHSRHIISSDGGKAASCHRRVHLTARHW